MGRMLLLTGVSLLMAGCSTTTASPPASPSTTEACDAAPAQMALGRTATGEVGAELLRVTGARDLRWLAPGMAATMDFRADRLTVSYDDKMTITRIACG